MSTTFDKFLTKTLQCFSSLVLVLINAHAHAQASTIARDITDSTINSIKLNADETITMDGTLEHPAWQRATVYKEFVEQRPVNGATPKLETGLRVLAGQSALYIGINAQDSNPELIRAPLIRHDGVGRSQDSVTVYLDVLGKKKAAQFFRVNASGSTTDGMHTSEDDSEDLSPDFDFDVATSRDSQGYTAVFRIPYASLRYTSKGEGPWRMMVIRNVPREQSYSFASVPIPPDASSLLMNLQALSNVALPESDNFLQLRPSITTRRTTTALQGSDKTPQSSNNLSLDIKWRPMPELVVDATLKPDFSQVELDVPQLGGNTRFALFYPEKRPFFLESSDLLRSPSDAIYTRSITLPRWGARASVRTEVLAGTAFTAQDEGGGLVLLPGCSISMYGVIYSVFIESSKIL